MNATRTNFFSSGLLLTDGGLETHLIFDHGFEFPEAAAFVLLDDERGRATMRDSERSCMDEAVRGGLGLVLESPTWRANPDWGTQVGFDRVALDRANRRAIDFIAELREEYGVRLPITLLSGSIGPRGDAYTPGERRSAEAHGRIPTGPAVRVVRRYPASRTDSLACSSLMGPSFVLRSPLGSDRSRAVRTTSRRSTSRR